MFNRQPFNRGKFNRSPKQTNRVLMGGSIALSISAFGNTNIATALNGDIDINVDATGDMTRATVYNGDISIALSIDGHQNIGKPFGGEIDINLQVDGNLTRGRTFSGNIPITLTLIGEGFNNFQTELIRLVGMRFNPGDEMIIDTDNQTVTINGRNAMLFVTRESEFFFFYPGVNEVTHQTTPTNARVDMRILWKDALL